jgi:hypothetical protein
MLLITSCNVRKLSNENIDSFITEFDKEKYNQYYSINAIPRPLLKFLDNNSIWVANPNEDYNYSSLIVENMPNIGLVFLGLSENGYGYLYYMYGFPNSNYNCLIFKINKNQVSNLFKIKFFSNDIHSNSIENYISSMKFRLISDFSD